jgi:serine/threonine protein kinase
VFQLLLLGTVWLFLSRQEILRGACPSFPSCPRIEEVAVTSSNYCKVQVYCLYPTVFDYQRMSDYLIPSFRHLEEHYVFSTKLGEGGFGVVHIAVERETNERIAVKSIKKANLRGQNSKESQIENEINIMRQLDHPNIIKFFGLVEDEKNFLICMECCEGRDLFDKIIMDKRKYTERDARDLVAIFIDALRHMHSHPSHFVHRDIKAENIMLRYTDSLTDIRLIDFGLATEEHKIARYGAGRVGTEGYMAPEMYSYRGYTRAVDLWSLGVFMFILFYGQYPINPDNPQLRAKLHAGDFQFPVNSRVVVSDEARDFIAKLMHKDLSKRLTVDTALHHDWVRIFLFSHSVVLIVDSIS